MEELSEEEIKERLKIFNQKDMDEIINSIEKKSPRLGKVVRDYTDLANNAADFTHNDKRINNELTRTIGNAVGLEFLCLNGFPHLRLIMSAFPEIEKAIKGSFLTLIIVGYYLGSTTKK